MAEEHWQQARLIPTSGINGAEEAERRATSALLAVLGAVNEFGQALLKPLGAPSGKVSTFIEVPFKVGDGTCYPDGLVEVTRGSKSWTTLIEVKIDNSRRMPGFESWWDVPIAEVSGVAGVKAARSAYERKLPEQRQF